ncbi:DNA repair protein RecO [Spelaeicoccus albus]|uniref:DNA repair protein RecO n=1 Tax=Spelaeicoccus albus TaxID=1280376 RepID=A0A7Z0II91_9MICO|nr:DNA repair protein RecO [Spelaeicoccus albus]NYI68196.1 DNA repair protein RecO (recombination protein O) [Spelaeicoccus albus]
MSLYRDDAIVLRTHKLGEADRIVTMLTRNNGQVRAVAKGVRRTKSKFGSRLEPFMLIDVQLHRGRNLDIITQAATLEPFGGSIASDYSCYTAATAIVETTTRLTEADGMTLQQYWLVVGALRSLATRAHAPSLIVDAYLLRALAVAGWAPSFVDCARCGRPGPHSAFTPALGGAVCSECRPPGSAAPAPDTFRLLAALLGGDWQTADAAPARAQREASGLVSAYLQWHLERGLRSLRMVERA